MLRKRVESRGEMKHVVKLVMLGLSISVVLLSGRVSYAEDPEKGVSSQAAPTSPGTSDLSPETQPTPTEQLLLKVNLPATRLDLYSNGNYERSYPVAIGMPKYPTPIRDYSISLIIWNPWWLPPDSEWAQDAEKTPPGPGNPLGAVKLIMEDGIRIHGTNAPGSVGHASSHACLRMKSADVAELAWRIQQAYSEKREPELLDKYRKSRKTSFYVMLFQAVPVTVEYVQVEPHEDKLWIHPDRYGHGGFQEELEAVLTTHPEISVNKNLLAKLRKLRSKGTVEVSWEELVQWSQESAPVARDNAGQKI